MPRVPGRSLVMSKGKEHPLSIIQREAISIFTELGFEVAHAPEVETEWFNFDALNLPKDHPARTMQDTFWIRSEERKVLRTHVTNMTSRTLAEIAKGEKKPGAYISIG